MRELGVAEGFRLAAVGDCIVSRPLAQLIDADQGLRRIVAVLRGADVAIGNLETAIVDVRRTTGSPRTEGDWPLAAEPGVARDLAALGFRAMGLANNHSMDWGVEGLRETGRHLDDAGVAHAGAGERLALARAPRYVETSGGRVGLVSVVTRTIWDQIAALDPFGAAPGRPGVSALRLKRIITVPPPAFDALRELDRLMQPWSDSTADVIEIFESRVMSGDEVGVRYEADPDDLAEILRALRLAAAHADLVVLSVHAHEEGPDPATPPEALRSFAHAAIDAGADLFVGHGVHRLWPIEVHEGRPILYGLGNFVWSDLTEPLPRALYESARDLPMHRLADPWSATDADVTAAINEGFLKDSFFQSVVAELIVREGAPDLVLHPIDLRRDPRLTRRGIPRPADPRLAEAIIERLAEISAPFGTKFGLEEGAATLVR
jgi:poly-gamma-glutamate synthesis protein (capsule biosynthesis protein)